MSLLRVDALTQRCPYHVLNVQILDLLQREGFIRGFKVDGSKIEILLKYYRGAPVRRRRKGSFTLSKRAAPFLFCFKLLSTAPPSCPLLRRPPQRLVLFLCSSSCSIPPCPSVLVPRDWYTGESPDRSTYLTMRFVILPFYPSPSILVFGSPRKSLATRLST